MNMYLFIYPFEWLKNYYPILDTKSYATQFVFISLCSTLLIMSFLQLKVEVHLSKFSRELDWNYAHFFWGFILHFVKTFVKIFLSLLKDFFSYLRIFWESSRETIFISLKYCFSFLPATVTNYHKLDGIQQCEFIFLQLWRQYVQNQLCYVEIKV